MAAQMSLEETPGFRLSLDVHKEVSWRNPLAVQWWGLCSLTAVARVQSLVREQRSCMPSNAAKKKERKKKKSGRVGGKEIYIPRHLPKTDSNLTITSAHNITFHFYLHRVSFEKHNLNIIKSWFIRIYPLTTSYKMLFVTQNSIPSPLSGWGNNHDRL